MTSLLLAAGGLLLIVIVAMILRVASLISMVQGPKTMQQAPGNKANAILWLAFLVLGGTAAVWSAFSASDYFLPEPSSQHGHQIDDMFWITNGIICAVFLALHVLLCYFPYKYQYRHDRRASFYPDNNRLEVIWTIVPAFVLTLLVLSGWKVWRDVTSEPPQQAFPIELVGRQFNWLIRYPGTGYLGADNKRTELGGFDFRLIDANNEVGMDLSDANSFDDFLPREIHLPKGQPVVFKIRGRDVIHSVFLPHFRLKMDAVPGMPTKFWFTPTKTTQEMRAELENPEFNYELACTEVCGRGHFSMRTIVVVEEPAEFKAWLAKQKPWLAQNRDYLNKVPANLQERALQVIGPGDGGAAPENADDTTAAPAPDAAALLPRDRQPALSSRQ